MLNRLYAKYGRRLAFVAVTGSPYASDRVTAESEADVQAFGKYFSVRYPVAYDPPLSVANHYLQGGFPRSRSSARISAFASSEAAKCRRPRSNPRFGARYERDRATRTRTRRCDAPDRPRARVGIGRRRSNCATIQPAVVFRAAEPGRDPGLWKHALPRHVPADAGKAAQSAWPGGSFGQKSTGPHSVTVDPRRDVPSVLRSYLSRFGGQFIGLTDAQSQIDSVEKRYNGWAQKLPSKSGVHDYRREARHHDLFHRSQTHGCESTRSRRFDRRFGSCDTTPVGLASPQFHFRRML